MLTADFNGDGIMDVAVLNPKGIQVLLGQGGGAFESEYAYTLPGQQRTGYIQSGDFNHDGHLDLAFSVTGTMGKVAILLGNGDGTFQSPIFSQILRNPGQFAVGDLNNDGNPDLAVQLVTGKKVAVLLGNGDGTFQPTSLVTVNGATPPLGQVFINDLNADGQQDILVLGNQACTLLGAGNGTFTAGPCTASAGSSGVGIIGDFDQNGAMDIAVIEANAPYSVDILLGNGDGSFQPPVKYPFNFQPVGLQVSNLTSAGPSDIVVAGKPGIFSILAGIGDGTFTLQPQQYVQGSSGVQFAVADFTGDGIPDAIFSEVLDSTLTLAPGNGDLTFQAVEAFSAGTFASSYAGLATADFNGDGFMDAATVDATGVTLTLGNGDGTFQSSTTGIASGTTLPAGIVAGDFNGDHVTDLAVLGGLVNSSSGVELLFGNGNGTFQPPVNVAAGDDPVKFVTGDFNNDGHTDFAVLNACIGTCRTGDSITVLLGDGQGNFTSEGPYIVGRVGPLFILTADLNRDGFADLAVLSKQADGNSYVTVLLNNGDGTFAVKTTIWFAPLSGVIVALTNGDMNNDGIQDLIVTAQELIHGDTALFVLIGVGDGTFVQPGIKSRLGYGNNPSVADGTGNGIQDLIYPVPNALRFLLGNGNGTFSLTPVSLPSTTPATIAPIDLNADGNTDLLVVGNSGIGGTLYLEPLLATTPTAKKRP